MNHTPTSKMDETLAERGGRYGDWRGQAEIAQALKIAAMNSPNWSRIPAYMRETMDLIFNKFARILNGDWTYEDNWHDVVGYAKLAEDRLIQDNANPDITRPEIMDLSHPNWERLIDLLENNGFIVRTAEPQAVTLSIITGPGAWDSFRGKRVQVIAGGPLTYERWRGRNIPLGTLKKEVYGGNLALRMPSVSGEELPFSVGEYDIPTVQQEAFYEDDGA